MAVQDFVGRTVWYGLLLWAIARWLNRRTLTTERPYDFAVNMMFGTIAGDAVLFHRVPLWGGSLALGVLAAALWTVEAALRRFPALAVLVVGRPVPLAQGGQVVSENLRRAHLTKDDLLAKLREAKIADVADVELAQLEVDGKIGIVLKKPG
jgi:uncharacterized membrane protein YcaP (DUF421 family)